MLLIVKKKFTFFRNDLILEYCLFLLQLLKPEINDGIVENMIMIVIVQYYIIIYYN